MKLLKEIQLFLLQYYENKKLEELIRERESIIKSFYINYINGNYSRR